MQQYERAARGFDDYRYLTAARIERQTQRYMRFLDFGIVTGTLFFLGVVLYAL